MKTELAIVRTTKDMVEQFHFLDPEMVEGEWEVEVTFKDGTTEYYGPYKTKKDAEEAKRDMKKSKW